MHKLLVHASRLTLSLFSSRQRPFVREHCTSHHSSHAPRVAAPRKTSDSVQIRMPERHSQAHAPAAPRITAARPVRVLRLREGAAERLAIVGRMADVCAELDRLVARESHCG